MPSTPARAPESGFGPRLRRGSLRWGLALTALLLIAPLFAATAYLARQERGEALARAGERAEALARLAIANQDDVVAQVRLLIDRVSTLPEIVAAARGGACPQELLSGDRRILPYLTSLRLSDPAGNGLCGDPVAYTRPNVADRAYFRDAMAGQPFVLSDYLITRPDNHPRLLAAAPVRGEDGAVLGVVSTSIDVASFARLLTTLRATRSSSVTLLDGSGVVIAHEPAVEGLVGRSLAGSAIVRRALAERDGSAAALDWDGGDRLFAWEPMPGTRAIALVSLDRTRIIARLDAGLRRRLLIIGGIVLLGMALAALGAELTVFRPLRALRDWADALARPGDAPARAGRLADVAPFGEVAVLAGSLQRMSRDVADRERLLADAQALFRGLFDHAADGLFVHRVEADGTFALEIWNATASRLLGGATPETHAGRPLETFIPPEAAAETTANLAATLEAGEPRTFVGTNRRNADGRSWEIVHVPIRDGTGRVSRIFASVREVTHLKAAEAKAREQNRLLQMSEAASHVGHWHIDGRTDTLFWSDEVFRIHGMTPAAAAPSREEARAAYHPDDRARAAGEIASALAQSRAIDYRARLIRPDGEERQVHVRAFCQTTDGDERSLFGVIVDVTDQVRAETRLRGTVARLRFALEAGRMFAWERDTVSEQVTRSDNASDVLGFSEGGVDRFYENIHPDDRERVRLATDEAISHGVSYDVEFRYTRPDGTLAWLNDIGRLVTEDGHPRFFGLCFDTTARKLAEEALRESEQRLALALDSGSDGLWDWTIPSGVCWYSDRWHTMLGYAPRELPGHIETWERLVHPDDKADVTRATRDHFEGRSPAYEAEHRLRRKDGTWGWVLSRGKVVGRDALGRPERMVGTHIDIGARKEAERRIAHIARHDPLTDLPNRALFRESLDQRLAAVGRGGGSLAVLCLDLDRFKAINDTLGHAAGDALLREVANRIRATVRAEDVVARLGGDEFAVLQVGGTGEPEAAAAAAARLIEAVSRPLLLDGKEAHVGVSVGIALAPTDGLDGDKLFKSADLALYRAKGEGRNTFRFFEHLMDDEVEARRRLELEMRGALVRGEFELHYQPVVSASTERIGGFEALLRWTSPERGPVSPAMFIPLAEETGLIVALGDWVLRTACAEAAGWEGGGMVAVNISAVQFRRGSLAQTVAAALADSGLAPERLELEITESVLIQDDAGVGGTLHALHALGVGIALDDFGTGYSSLSYLCRFPFDRIKIDRSFVAGLADPNSAAIVRAIIGLGRQFGMPVTAEGVETIEQLAALKAAGCSDLQGYFFSPARPARDLPSLLAKDSTRSAA